MSSSADASNERFAFGDNWRCFIPDIDERRIDRAVKSFCEMLDPNEVSGRRFLDIGCGSGLSSLVARRLGSRVHAFDHDPVAVQSALALRQREAPDSIDWQIEQGDILEDAYVAQLGPFDIVHAWGVLHHTGRMWQALANAADLVAPDGLLFVAIYNDQGGASHRWSQIKHLYHRLPRSIRPLFVAACVPIQWWKDLLKDGIRGRPLHAWRRYSEARGMSPWRDMVDWVGGHPFEVARPEEVFNFVRDRGFALEALSTCGGGIGCNEFVFRRTAKRP